MNLRTGHVRKTKIGEALKDPNITRLSNDMIDYLESVAPLHLGPTGYGNNKLSFDSLATLNELKLLIQENKISNRVAHLEIRRRSKIKHG